MQRRLNLPFYASLLSVGLLLVACNLAGMPEQPENERELEAFAADTTDEPTLLSSWSVLTTTNVFGGPVRNYDMRYFPRQLEAGETLSLSGENADEGATGGVSGGEDPGSDLDEDSGGTLRVDDAAKYAGWDLLTTPENPAFFGGVAKGEDWLGATLTRDAQLAVVWSDENTPTWLEAWNEGEEVELNGENHRVFEQTFEAGEVTLPAPAPGTNYLLLLAEADGEPSAEPGVPEGKEAPMANQPCPAWVHDQYVAEGPDGRLYPSWHPQIDPVYTCTFDHEHGSDPALLPGDHDTIYGYVTERLSQDESHEGFKNFAVKDEVGNTWMITLHGKSSDLRRYCVDLHTFKFKVVDPEGELLADLQYKGDFGHSRDESGDVLQLPECEQNQREIKEASPFTAKSFPDVDGEGVDGLEQWLTQVGPDVVSGAQTGNLLGLNTLSFVIYYVNPAKLCTAEGCVTKGSGERRYMIPVIAPSIDADLAAEEGTFYTDPYGNELRDEEDDDAVAQFVKPGLDISLPGNIGTTYVTDDAFGMAYRNDGNALEPLDATPDMDLGGLTNN